MKEKCEICNEKHVEMLLHCKSCLRLSKVPHGLMEVSYDDTWVYVHCANCGDLVYKFAKMIR